YVALWQVTGPVHWSDQDLGYAIGLAAVTVFAGVIAIAMALRVVVAGLRGSLTRQRLVGPGSVWIDAPLLDLGGVVIGTAIVTQLAWALAGTQLGARFDWAVGGAAMALGIALTGLAVHRRSLRPILPAATLGMIGALALYGAGQTTRILSQAEVLAAGAPWCFARTAQDSPLATQAELGFFSLAKSRSDRHLSLVIAAPGGLQNQYWSIRRQSFVADGAAEAPRCRPTSNQAARFAGHIETRLADMWLRIPTSAAPQHGFAGLSIQTDVVPPDRVGVYGFGARVTITEPGSPPPPPDAQPLMDLPGPGDLDLAALAAGDLRLTFAGLDPATGQPVAISCLSGAFADRLCQVSAERGGLRYQYMVPVEDLGAWSNALDRIDAEVMSYIVPAP
ncbi:MAG: hypothetical protein AAF914_15835, partial [Pseudomonadota bacterium]